MVKCRMQPIYGACWNVDLTRVPCVGEEIWTYHNTAWIVKRVIHRYSMQYDATLVVEELRD